MEVGGEDATDSHDKHELLLDVLVIELCLALN